MENRTEAAKLGLEKGAATPIKDNDGHKMSEDFSRMCEEIVIIDKLLVRPEGWNK